MRDRDVQAGLRNYRYCVIRTRLPDSRVLQAMFYPSETIAKVRQVIHSTLREELLAYPFSLLDPTGRVVSDDSVSTCTL